MSSIESEKECSKFGSKCRLGAIKRSMYEEFENKAVSRGSTKGPGYLLKPLKDSLVDKDLFISVRSFSPRSIKFETTGFDLSVFVRYASELNIER